MKIVLKCPIAAVSSSTSSVRSAWCWLAGWCQDDALTGVGGGGPDGLYLGERYRAGVDSECPGGDLAGERGEFGEDVSGIVGSALWDDLKAY